MPDELQVEPAALYHVGRQLVHGASDGQVAFARHHGTLTEAAAGLFIRSRSALDTKADAWRANAAELTERVDSCGNHVHTSAARYESTDGKNATALYRRTDADSAKLNLEL
ncbi:hypothetical protein GCM10009624_23050 [Gordonia sinesedis]